MPLYSEADIESMSGPQLVEAYNGLVGPDDAVKRFASRSAGIRRLKAALKKSPKKGGGGRKKKSTTKKKKGGAAKQQGDVVKPSDSPQGVNRRKAFNLPVVDEIRSHRTGTKRAKLVDLLTRKGGATMQECMRATGWDYATCYRGIFMLHYDLHYGIQEDASGNIQLVL